MKTTWSGLLLSLLLPSCLLAYDRSAWTSYPNMNYITSLAEGDDQVFVGTTAGIRRYDRFREGWLSPLTILDGLPDSRVQGLSFDPDTGDLWFDSPAGPARWMSRLEVMYLAARIPVTLRRNRPPAAIPPVFPPFGYFIDDGVIRGPYQSYPITDALVDSWNVLWIGTWGLGVGRADLHDEQLSFLQFGPFEQNVTAIARDGEDIWFGGDDDYRGPARVITRYRPSSREWEYFDSDRIVGLDDARVSHILVDTTDVWFGTHRGVVRYARKSGRWLTYYLPRRHPGRITALARDGSRLWMGTESGLAVLDILADTIRVVAGSERFDIRGLTVGAGYVWAGTDLGLYQCPTRDVMWSAVQDPDGLARSPISGVCVQGDDIWATVETLPALLRGSGTGGRWGRFSLSDVGPQRRVSLAADSTRVWVATDGGALRFDVSRQLWKRYSQSDGLIHDRVQALQLDGEHIWFGTAEGVSRYHWAEDFFEKD